MLTITMIYLTMMIVFGLIVNKYLPLEDVVEIVPEYTAGDYRRLQKVLRSNAYREIYNNGESMTGHRDMLRKNLRKRWLTDEEIEKRIRKICKCNSIQEICEIHNNKDMYLKQTKAKEGK